MLRLLHTSDWHLGHSLFHKDRRREHGLFLDWLLHGLAEWQVDALVVAGDIFDTVAPPNYALTLYYDFLRRLMETPCRQAIIIGGNHDSASSLHAPRQLLRCFNIHVIGTPDRDDPAADLVVLRDRHDRPAGVVAAVPFLRERDVRRSVAGESYSDKSRAYLQGVADHYALLHDLGRGRITELCGRPDGLPLIASGHLFAAGGEVSEGEREVTVGTLGGVPVTACSQGFDYLALGHLHKAQALKGPCPARYAGSPLPLSFSEAASSKEVTLVSFAAGVATPQLLPIPVPRFQAMRTVRGDWSTVAASLAGLADVGPPLWLEVQLEAEVWGPGVQEQVAELCAGKAVEVLAVRNIRRLVPRLGDGDEAPEVLTALSPDEVFTRRLAQAEASADDAEMLTPLYREVVVAATRAMEGAGDED